MNNVNNTYTFPCHLLYEDKFNGHINRAFEFECKAPLTYAKGEENRLNNNLKANTIKQFKEQIKDKTWKETYAKKHISANNQLTDEQIYKKFIASIPKYKAIYYLNKQDIRIFEKAEFSFGKRIVTLTNTEAKKQIDKPISYQDGGTTYYSKKITQTIWNIKPDTDLGEWAKNKNIEWNGTGPKGHYTGTYRVSNGPEGIIISGHYQHKQKAQTLSYVSNYINNEAIIKITVETVEYDTAIVNFGEEYEVNNITHILTPRRWASNINKNAAEKGYGGQVKVSQDKGNNVKISAQFQKSWQCGEKNITITLIWNTDKVIMQREKNNWNFTPTKTYRYESYPSSGKRTTPDPNTEWGAKVIAARKIHGEPTTELISHKTELPIRSYKQDEDKYQPEITIQNATKKTEHHDVQREYEQYLYQRSEEIDLTSLLEQIKKRINWEKYYNGNNSEFIATAKWWINNLTQNKEYWMTSPNAIDAIIEAIEQIKEGKLLPYMATEYCRNKCK